VVNTGLSFSANEKGKATEQFENKLNIEK